LVIQIQDLVVAVHYHAGGDVPSNIGKVRGLRPPRSVVIPISTSCGWQGGSVGAASE
jgi:hypothetical protein